MFPSTLPIPIAHYRPRHFVVLDFSIATTLGESISLTIASVLIDWSMRNPFVPRLGGWATESVR